MMKLNLTKPKPVIYQTHRENVVVRRLTAGIAVLAWLTLAGEAFAQTANQWAPVPATPLQQPQAAQNTQVWSTGGNAGPVFAPTDLDQQLETGGTVRPVPQAPATQPVATGPAAPVYAPATLATPQQAPAQPVAPAPQQPGQPYASPYPAQPYYGGYAAQPNPGAGYGYGGYPYGGGVPGFGLVQPYGPAIPGLPGNYPYGGYGYPGIGLPPGLGGLGSPYNSYNSFGGIPFFGGSPFGFW